MKTIGLFVGILCMTLQINAQYVKSYGVKGGLSIGTQKWSGVEREALFSWNGITFLELAREDNNFIFYSQLGYHNKGSAVISRTFYNPQTMQNYPRQVFGYVFKNLSLVVGGKSQHDLGNVMKGYYLLGIRGDLNLGTDLNVYEVLEEYVNKVTYGVTLGGGLEFPLRKNLSLDLGFQVSPDFSDQIFIPQGQYRNSITNELTVFPAQKVVNTTFEVVLGLRFGKNDKGEITEEQ